MTDHSPSWLEPAAHFTIRIADKNRTRHSEHQHQPPEASIYGCRVSHSLIADDVADSLLTGDSGRGTTATACERDTRRPDDNPDTAATLSSCSISLPTHTTIQHHKSFFPTHLFSLFSFFSTFFFVFFTSRSRHDALFFAEGESCGDRFPTSLTVTGTTSATTPACRQSLHACRPWRDRYPFSIG